MFHEHGGCTNSCVGNGELGERREGSDKVVAFLKQVGHMLFSFESFNSRGRERVYLPLVWVAPSSVFYCLGSG